MLLKLQSPQPEMGIILPWVIVELNDIKSTKSAQHWANDRCSVNTSIINIPKFSIDIIDLKLKEAVKVIKNSIL